MVATLGGYLVHLYTATGVLWGWLALRATLEGDLRQALLWLAVATFVDATDGFFARLADITRSAPRIDGARLDDIVDYVTYVFVPGVIVWKAPLVPPGWAAATVGAMLLSSACGFARRDAKTADHFFTGFPSYWNIVVVYLLATRMPLEANAGVLIALAGLVFAPIRFVYPSRTAFMMKTTVAFCAVWGVQMIALVWQLPQPPRALVWSAFAFPVYYTLLSLRLTLQRR